MERKDYWEEYEKIPAVNGESNTAPASDPIHPSYYKGKIEVIDFIESYSLGFCLGNCVKYIARAGKKDPDKYIEDLKKAQYYLQREIDSTLCAEAGVS